MGYTNLFKMNGVEIELTWAKENTNELTLLVKEIENDLITLDIASFAKKMEKYRINDVLKIADSLYRDSYIRFINRCLDGMVEKSIPINITNLFDVIRYGTFELGKLKTRSKTHEAYYSAKTTIEGCIPPYKKAVIRKLHGMMKERDKESIWKYSSAFKRNEFVSMLVEAKEDFYEYILHCSAELTGGKLSWLRLFFYSVHGINRAKAISHECIKIIEKNGDYFKKITSDLYNKKITTSKGGYSFNDDIWKIEYSELKSIKSVTLDFSSFPNAITKKEIKDYAQSLIQTKESYKKTQMRITSIKGFSYELFSIYDEITSFAEVNYDHATHLLIHFQNLEEKAGQKKYKLSTIRGFFSEMKLFLRWLYEARNINKTNPFDKITFNNTSSFTERTPFIPETVVSQINEHLDELPDSVQNAWIIMMNSGARISDVYDMDDECLYYDTKLQSYILQYTPRKTDKRRRKKGLPEYHKIPIAENVALAVQNQKDATEELRFMCNSKKIFLTRSDYGITQQNPQRISWHINELIKRHRIIDENGELFHYTHQQCRKTRAVDMLTNGASIEEVADFLAHMSTKTTATYYKDVELKKIADLDAQYFEEAFNEMIDDDIKGQYTEEERASLIKEVKLGARETPEGHGTCVKHVSFGPCVKKSCVGCKMLTTGPQKLPKWYQLYKEQEEHILELESMYQNENLDGFENFREYQHQKTLLEIYKDTIDKVENFAKKRGIFYGE